MRMSRSRDLNIPSIEYFLVEDDDGCTVCLGATRQYSDDCEIAQTRLPCAVNLPSDKLRGNGSDHAIAKVVYI